MLTIPATLVQEKRMLTGFSLSYGNSRQHERFSVGLRCEVEESQNGRFSIRELPVTDSTVFDLASLTKLFTCVSALMLMEQRALRMTDCVGRADPRFPFLGDVSVYDLLTYRAILKSPERVDAQSTPEQAEKMVFATAPSSAAQQKIYSDMNALVLKYVIEAVTGLRYIDFLKRHVFAPLEMRETWGKVPDERRADCVNYNYEHMIVKGQHRVSHHVVPACPHDPKARALSRDDGNTSGHAGLFSTMGDMVRFAQGLLQGRLIRVTTLRSIGLNRTGHLQTDGTYRQYMGLLCFSKSAVPRLSEVPMWMGKRAFGLSGYTGNHIAVDPDLDAFDILLGNRCHNRVSAVAPESEARALGLAEDGSGAVAWPDGRTVWSSHKYVYLKDRLIHEPVYRRLKQLQWLPTGGEKA